MISLMLDTSAYTAFKLGDSTVLEAIQKSPKILIPLIVFGELLAGFEAGSRREQNRQELTSFLQSPRVRLVPVIADTAERYALIYAYLRQKGRPIPTNDLWIAASAMEHSAELLTADGHFLHVPQIITRSVRGA
ncbi:MAG: type II toxin-antitoxin system VapC family toxin [Anaerolineae bacterium]|nr:type II toxin-antitoxin system VapC family toxin [Anaerolineae bacterium]